MSLEDPLEKGIATHSSILAWRIPCTEEPDSDMKRPKTSKCKFPVNKSQESITNFQNGTITIKN